MILFSHTSSLRLLMLLLMLVYGISGQGDSTSVHTIDESINGASNTNGASSMIGDSSGRMIRTELDMMLTQEQYRVLYGKESRTGSSRNKRAVVFAPRWTNKQIPYTISSIFSSQDRKEIQEAMSEWQLNTCITFREATSYDRNFVFFQDHDGRGCYATLGMTGGRQIINLGIKDRCRSKQVIIHEIGHTVGLVHEQSRPDRDNYVTILKHNILPSTDISNFQKYHPTAVSTYGIPYDYLSIMHYGETFFAKRGLITIQTKDPSYQKRIGNQNRLSFRDIKLANLIYKCGEKCNPSIVCPGEGFVGKDCKCWCPGSPMKQCDGTEPLMTTKSPTSESCVDMNPNCPYWFQNGYCQTHVSVRNACRNSCSLCGLKCVDVDERCQYWKNQGYCYNSEYATNMHQNCPFSCGLCS